MNRSRNPLWLLLLILIVCAVLPKLYSSKQSEVAPDGDWIDLMQVWQPDEFSSAYRFWLPSPQPLQVTLVKWNGGNRNRPWQISIESSRDFSPPLAPIRRTEFGNDTPFGQVGKVISERSFVGSNEGLFDDCRPSIWYRRRSNTWQFLAYQNVDAPGPGSIEVVPRSKIKLGQECQYGEGYFTWQPAGKWLACDRRGSIAP